MHDNILKEAEQLRTLGDVLHWAFARTPPADLVTVVTQDEFTHDVVIRVSSQLYLAFDTT